MGYALNFCRYGIYAPACGLISGSFEPETLEALFGPDILQYAGLALCFTGVLKELKLREGHLLAIGVIRSAFYFLLKRIPAEKLRVFLEMSQKLTPIYLIHWCILGFIDSIFCYLLEIPFSWPVIFLIGAVLIALSALIAKRWADRKTSPKAAQKGRNGNGYKRHSFMGRTGCRLRSQLFPVQKDENADRGERDRNRRRDFPNRGCGRVKRNRPALLRALLHGGRRGGRGRPIQSKIRP